MLITILYKTIKIIMVNYLGPTAYTFLCHICIFSFLSLIVGTIVPTISLLVSMLAHIQLVHVRFYIPQNVSSHAAEESSSLLLTEDFAAPY